MKIIISQEVLAEAVSRGGLAALSEEAQGDSSVLQLLLKAIKIKVDEKEITIESAAKLLSTKYTLSLENNPDISVKEAGEVIVPAKDFLAWIKAQQKGAKLAIVFKALDTPEIINPLASEVEGSAVKGIKKIGIINIVSKDESRTGSKSAFDCYQYEEFGDPIPNIDTKKKFTIPVKQIVDGIKMVSVSVLPTHYQHLWDSICFQQYNNKLYMATTDAGCASVYELTEAKDIDMPSKFLAPYASVASVVKAIDENEPVSMYFDEKAAKVYLTQGTKFSAKMSTTDVPMMAKFPDLKMIIDLTYSPVATVDKDKLVNRLNTSSLVNREAAMFIFGKDQFHIYAISSIGKQTNTSEVPVKNLGLELDVVWKVGKIIDYLRLIKDEEVEILMQKDRIEKLKADTSTSPDKWYAIKSIKITSKQDPNSSCIMMPCDPVKFKYDKVEMDNIIK